MYRLQMFVKLAILDDGERAQTLVELAKCLRDELTVQLVPEMMNDLTGWIAAGCVFCPILNLEIVEL